MRMSPIMYVTDNEKLMDMMIAASSYNSHAHPTSYESCLKLKDLYLWDDPLVSDVEILPFKRFEVTAEPTIEFIEKLHNNMITQMRSVQSCILLAVNCGGDTDTNASIIGELVNHYAEGITKEDADYVEYKLSLVDPFLVEILKEFNEKF